MIIYTDSVDGITPEKLHGFFVGWPHPPTTATHLKILGNSTAVVLAVDEQQVVGYINALGDGFHAAFIPGLEVLPEYQGRGIGTELVRRMLKKLDHYYAIDLMCDPAVQPFYERLGLRRSVGMVSRNFARQGGG